MDSQEFSDNSQPSITPSPLFANFDDLNSSQKSLSDFSQLSQPSSIPSPTVTTLNKMLQSQTVHSDCKHDFDFICSNLTNLNPDQKAQVFAIVMPQLNKSDLQLQSEQLLLHLSKIFGEFCRDKIRHEADNFRMKRSLDDTDCSSVEILSKRLKIEELHAFFESATGKSGRLHHKNQVKIAECQATFYESLLKGSNLNTLGPFSLMKANQVKLKVQSKAVFINPLGGSYTYHQQNTPAEDPLEMSYKGPLISDNAQLGCGKGRAK